MPARLDAAAYNNYLMLQSYLVVPTNGLSADKALALAQFIRFAVGANGQADIASLGAAPATPKMVTADLAVAQELDAEAASAPTLELDGTSTTTTTRATTATTTPRPRRRAPVVRRMAPCDVRQHRRDRRQPAWPSPVSDPIPLLALGFAFLACGEGARQLLRRRRTRV